MQLPASSKNWISITGAVIAVFSLVNMVMLIFVMLLMKHDNPYIGIILYLVMPGILVLGLILIPVGMWLHRKKHGEQNQWPSIDLNLVHHRNAAIIFVVGSVIVLFVSVTIGYEAFHFSESVEFCGTVCHSVMTPEYTAYQNSAHARVACVSCHVGEGAKWYVKSKISGAYQVYAVLANAYPRPIPTPIENLRPARETCEKCHWPQKFYTRQLRHEVYYLSDDANTKWSVDLMMKIGGEHESEGLQKGIHWHVNNDTQVEYVASDDKLETIPWVRYTNKSTGETVVYRDEENPVDDDELAKMDVMTMDCMSCHNRPSHKYNAPTRFINAALSAGDISTDIPEVKRLLTELCSDTYSTRDSAHTEITRQFNSFYAENYPDFTQANAPLLAKALTAALAGFDANVFPSMNARWDKYPSFIGHLESNGCFRCHNGTHVSEDGRTIRRDCQLCHTIQGEGTDDDYQTAPVGKALEFQHPVDIDGAWQDMMCTECHTGVNP